LATIGWTLNNNAALRNKVEAKRNSTIWLGKVPGHSAESHRPGNGLIC
jgi:hypothetical protein